MAPEGTPGARALIVGALGSAAIGAGVLYSNMVLQGSRIACYYNTPAAIILFFLLVFAANTAVGLIRRNWILNRAELSLIYIMWIVATAIPTWGLTSYLLTVITSPIYNATPENNWSELLHPYIPDWIVPHHDFEQVRNFFEGAPEGQGIPWMLWLRPLAYWIPFAMALYLAMISCMVILRKQWIDHERLLFPLVQVPIPMIADAGKTPSLVKPIFRNPLMWLGFAVPAVLQSMNALNPYFPAVPRLYWGTRLSLFGDTFTVPIILSFQMLGFSYFVSRDILFGLCFFHLLNVAQQAVFAYLGIQKIDPLLSVFTRGGPMVAHQGLGAFIVLVLFGLWTAREHLAKVFRKALRGDAAVDDSDEILSYRVAVIMLAASFLFMGIWLWRSGLPAWVTPIFLFLVFLIFVGLTRIVAEGGIVYIFAPMTASDFIVAGFGTRALGPTGIMAMAFTFVWASDILTSVMASCANGLKLAEEAIARRRRLIFWGIIVAIVVALGSSIWAMLAIAYEYGGINTDRWFFGVGSRYPFETAAFRMQVDEGPHWENWLYTGIGGTVQALLMVARQRFLWWPFHPLGFPVSLLFGTVFFSVFLAWVLKTLVIKYGGPQLYLRTRPIFLGLILGQFVTAGFWIGVSYFTGVPNGYNYLSGYF